MQYGQKHPSHSGEFVRNKGGWKNYHLWCIDNGYATLVPDKDGKLFPMFILKPRTSEKTQGRNEPCACGSGKKFKKCCN